MSRDDQKPQDSPLDPLLEPLAALPARRLEGEAAARIHRRARRAFLREAGLRERPWVIALNRLYLRAEPGLAVVVAIAYLGWAFETAAALVR